MIRYFMPRGLGTRFSGVVLTEALMSKSTLKASVGGRQRVHLAVHGSFVADEPLLSYSRLKADSSNDGRLTAAEMYGLPLDAAQLVTLIACETGTVRATHASEVPGMMRGRLFAGADALLLSAWKISDAACAPWMQAFDTDAADHTPAYAAMAVINTLLDNPAYRYPCYWSPFLLVSR